jgi:hypothetical protein
MNTVNNSSDGVTIDDMINGRKKTCYDEDILLDLD